jgi:hypothetical protein
MANSLQEQLKLKKSTLLDFFNTGYRALEYLNLTTTHSQISGDYKISKQKTDGVEKFLRPINQKLFIYEPEDFRQKFDELQEIFKRIKTKERDFSIEEKFRIDSVLYTIQQSIGAAFDLLVGSNSSRKHVGNRFEELVKVVFDEIGVSNKKTVLQIPYETDEGRKIYKCENDLILSPHETVKSSGSQLDESEIVVSAKTTSKDRMGKIFIDKILLERFVGHPQKVIGIFLNDVQRKESGGISFTLVSGLFMVYTKFLTPLEGIYYLDPPPNVQKTPYSNHMKRFSELITNDIWELFSS